MRDKRKCAGKTGARLYNPQENMSAGKAESPGGLTTAISVKLPLIEERIDVIDFLEK